MLVAGRLAPPSTRGVHFAALAIGAGLALVVPSATYRLATVDLPTWAVVVAKEDATVRFEPSAGGTVHYQAKPGSVVRVGGEREGWVNVVRADGRRGWVERGAIAVL